MEATREFHLGDILSITTHRLVSPRHIEGVYDILNYMTGDELWTHQLPRASDECEPYLYEQMPWLKDIDHSSVNRDTWKLWLDDMVARHGEYHAVRPIHGEDHSVVNPVQELLDMGVDEDRIITVALDDHDPIPPEGDVNWKVE